MKLWVVLQKMKEGKPVKNNTILISFGLFTLGVKKTYVMGWQHPNSQRILVLNLLFLQIILFNRRGKFFDFLMHYTQGKELDAWHPRVREAARKERKKLQLIDKEIRKKNIDALEQKVLNLSREFNTVKQENLALKKAIHIVSDSEKED